MPKELDMFDVGMLFLTIHEREHLYVAHLLKLAHLNPCAIEQVPKFVPRQHLLALFLSLLHRHRRLFEPVFLAAGHRQGLVAAAL